MTTIFRYLVLLVWAGSLQAAELIADEKVAPAGLVIVVYDGKGFSLDPLRQFPDTPAFSTRYFFPDNLISGLPKTIADGKEYRRREKAIEPALKTVDRDTLSQKLRGLVHCRLADAYVPGTAVVKDMDWFSDSMVSMLDRFTPGTVMLYQISTRLAPELDELKMDVRAELWEFKSRAISARQLKRLSKEEAERRRPNMIWEHSYVFSHRPYRPLAESLIRLQAAKTASPEEAARAQLELEQEFAQVYASESGDDRRYFERMAALWQADGGRLLHETIDAGIAYLDQEMSAQHAGDCQLQTAMQSQ